MRKGEIGKLGAGSWEPEVGNKNTSCGALLEYRCRADNSSDGMTTAAGMLRRRTSTAGCCRSSHSHGVSSASTQRAVSAERPAPARNPSNTRPALVYTLSISTWASGRRFSNRGRPGHTGGRGAMQHNIIEGQQYLSVGIIALRILQKPVGTAKSPPGHNGRTGFFIQNSWAGYFSRTKVAPKPNFSLRASSKNLISLLRLSWR